MRTYWYVPIMKELERFFAWTYESAQHGNYTGICIVVAILAVVVFVTVKVALSSELQS